MNHLSKVRRLIACLNDGVIDAAALRDAVDVDDRHLAYTRQAARILGVIVERGDGGVEIADAGRAILATAVDSDEERRAFRLAILDAAPLRPFRTFFEGADQTVAALGAHVQAVTGLSRSTAERRAQALMAWKRFVDGRGPSYRSRDGGRVPRLHPEHTEERMTTVGDVLTRLGEASGRDALARLCDIRGLRRRRGKDEMRAPLARSYRGDMKALIDDLRRQDLIDLLGAPEGILVGARWMRLPKAASMHVETLRQTAVAALVNGDGSLLSAADEEDGACEGDDDVEDIAAFGERLQACAGGRAVPIGKLLGHAGWGHFERLRTARFQELRRLVARTGHRLCDQAGRAFTDLSTSPGIEALVYVFSAHDPDDLEVDEGPSDARRETSAPVRGADPPTAPIRAVIMPTPSPTSPTSRQPQASAYEIAVARLRVLTGIPWTRRHDAPGWPFAFVAMALESVVLPPDQANVVQLVCAKYATGIHDIEAPLLLLRAHQDRGQLAALVDAFEVLNDEAGAEVAAVAAHMRQQLALEPRTPSDAPPFAPEAVRASLSEPIVSDQPRGIPSAADAAASPASKPSTASDADASLGVNGRDLGALKDIFD